MEILINGRGYRALKKLCIVIVLNDEIILRRCDRINPIRW